MPRLGIRAQRTRTSFLTPDYLKRQLRSCTKCANFVYPASLNQIQEMRPNRKVKEPIPPVQPSWARDWIQKGWIEGSYSNPVWDSSTCRWNSEDITLRFHLMGVRYLKGYPDRTLGSWRIMGDLEEPCETGEIRTRVFDIYITDRGDVSGQIRHGYGSNLSDYLSGKMNGEETVLQRKSPYQNLGKIKINF